MKSFFCLLGFLAIRVHPVITVLHPPTPVTINGRTTLYYELQIVHGAPTRIEVAGTILDQKEIAGRTRPGDTSIIYMEVVLKGPAPDSLIHYITIQSETIRTAIPVTHTAPIVLSPPLHGGPWAAVREPSWERGHRRVTFTANGHSRIPGRFAVDFILLNGQGKYVKGNEDSIRNWYGYAAEVLAVADGIVVKTRDDFKESPTLSAHPKYPAEQATGNFICIKIKEGQFVFYEHLQPGSIRVRPGQKIKRGRPIARLGFTGQTTGPHLHLHVADSDSPLGSEGLPFVFDRFTLLGGYPDFGVFGKEPWTAGNRSILQQEYPAPNTVIHF